MTEEHAVSSDSGLRDGSEPVHKRVSTHWPSAVQQDCLVQAHANETERTLIATSNSCAKRREQRRAKRTSRSSWSS